MDDIRRLKEMYEARDMKPSAIEAMRYIAMREAVAYIRTNQKLEVNRRRKMSVVEKAVREGAVRTFTPPYECD